MTRDSVSTSAQGMRRTRQRLRWRRGPTSRTLLTQSPDHPTSTEVEGRELRGVSFQQY